MKASEIESIYYALKTVKDKRLPVKVGLAVGRNLKKATEVCRDIWDKRNELIDRYAEKDEDGENVKTEQGIALADVESFTSEVNDLMSADITIEFDKVTMEDIEKCDTEQFDSLTGEEATALEAMIE